MLMLMPWSPLEPSASHGRDDQGPLPKERWSLQGMFPKIGVPPNHPILIGFSTINHPFLDTPIFGNTQIFSLQTSDL